MWSQMITTRGKAVVMMDTDAVQRLLGHIYHMASIHKQCMGEEEVFTCIILIKHKLNRTI